MRKLLERLLEMLVTETPGNVTTTKWVYNDLTNEERKTFTTQIDKEFVDYVLSTSWFIEDISKNFHDYCEEKGNNLMFLTRINYVRNGFGFSHYGNVFCHAKKYTNPENFEQDCKYQHFIVEAENTAKGLSAKRIILLDERLDNPANDELDHTIANIAMETFRENAIHRLRLIETNKRQAEERARKLALRDEKIFQLVGKYEKQVVEEWNHHGGFKEYNFFFEKEIDRDSFINFLTLLGLKTEAKPCYVPISPERVSFEPIVQRRTGLNLYGLPPKQGWHYKWIGEWDD